MGQEKLILHQNKTFFWQQMSHFYSCEDDCYQNCKLIRTTNLRWNYHLAMDEKWPNYRGMVAQYWISHQYRLAFYFWCSSRYGVTLFHLLGDWVSIHPCEADWTKTGGHYGKASLKEVLHLPPCITNGQHMWSSVILCAHGCKRLTACLWSTLYGA